MNKRIGFIGCGNMGKSMLGSLVKSKDINNEDIMVSTKSNTSAQNIIKEFNVKATTINSEVAKNSAIIFLAVKPFFFKEVIEEIKDVVKEDVIIISIAAGVTIEQIEEWFGKKIKLVRTMPNTPALVGEGMSAICPNNNVSEEELNYIGKLYNLFGKYEVIAEKDFHAFIALCGSSPAYVFMFIEAMADAASVVHNKFKGNIAYINVMKNMSVDCDCCAVAEDPCMKDIGVLASLDPVAIDKACIDLVYNSTDPGRDHLVERIDSRHGTHILEASNKLNFGTTNYELINIDK